MDVSENARLYNQTLLRYNDMAKFFDAKPTPVVVVNTTKWNDRGELLHDGVTVTGSNVIDLVHGAALDYSDELQRLLREAGGWGTVLLYRRSCSEGACVCKFVQRSPPIGSISNKARGCRIGVPCAHNRRADCRRCRSWAERQEGGKTKSDACR